MTPDSGLQTAVMIPGVYLWLDSELQYKGWSSVPGDSIFMLFMQKTMGRGAVHSHQHLADQWEWNRRL